MYIKLYLAVGLAVVVSALCSIFEAVLYSVPYSHIETLARSGRLSGRILKKQKKDIRKPITAILTLNTVANTMGAAIAGASFSVAVGEEYLTWFSLFFTLIILLFSEILPKTAGVVYSRPLAPLIALPLQWMVFILTPVIRLCEAVTQLIPHKNTEGLYSAQDIQTIALLSRKSGGIEPEQEKVIANILELQKITVRKVMTPRTVTFTIADNLTVGEAVLKHEKWSMHSRVPVYAKDQDDIVGIVLRKDVFLALSKGEEDVRMAQLMHPVHFVPESAPLNRVLMEFFERRQHLFVVVDEYGSVTGVISMEDIIEEIVGQEIIDESDMAGNMREFARMKRKALRGK